MINDILPKQWPPQLRYDMETDAGKFIEEYKGFVCRLNVDGHLNVMYVREDGTEACCGQTRDFKSSVESIIRYPLANWMLGYKPTELIFSPYHDPNTKNSCVHGISLEKDCYPCAESYGNNRAV